MPPSVGLRVRTSTAVAWVWPSVLLYLKLLVRVGLGLGLAFPAPVWQLATSAQPTSTVINIFIVLSRIPGQRVARVVAGVNAGWRVLDAPGRAGPHSASFRASGDTGRPACRPRRAPDWRRRRSGCPGWSLPTAPAARRRHAGVSGRSAGRCPGPAARRARTDGSPAGRST